MVRDPYAAIGEQSERIREHMVLPVALVDARLERIEALTPRINAFITVTADAARAAATAAE